MQEPNRIYLFCAGQQQATRDLPRFTISARVQIYRVCRRQRFPLTNQRHCKSIFWRLCNLKVQKRSAGYPSFIRAQRIQAVAGTLRAVWERVASVDRACPGSALPLGVKIAKKYISSSPSWYQLRQCLQLRRYPWSDDRSSASSEMRQMFTWTIAQFPPRARPPAKRRDLNLCPSPRSAIGSRERREAFDDPNGGLSLMV